MYFNTSDARLKKDVRELGATLPLVMRLEPLSFKYTYNGEADSRSLGFMAQDVATLFPELVSRGGDGLDHYGISYTGFSVIAIAAIQEQQEEIDALTKRIERLEKLLSDK